jgi:hypothetical protein
VTESPVAVFRWMGLSDEDASANPRRPVDWDPEQKTREASHPAAVALVHALREAGHSCNTPEDDDTSWFSDVSVGESSVRFIVTWTGIEYPPHNYIALQWHVRRTFLAWLLRRRVPQQVQAVAQAALDQALRSVPLVAGLRWLRGEEFASSYSYGKPLPRLRDTE